MDKFKDEAMNEAIVKHNKNTKLGPSANVRAVRQRELEGLPKTLKDEFSCAICGVSVDGMTPGELDNALFTNYKIHTVGIVWDNVSCVRITPHVYTRIQDLDKLVFAIEAIAKKSPASK